MGHARKPQARCLFTAKVKHVSTYGMHPTALRGKTRGASKALKGLIKTLNGLVWKYLGPPSGSPCVRKACCRVQSEPKIKQVSATSIKMIFA